MKKEKSLSLYNNLVNNFEKGFYNNLGSVLVSEYFLGGYNLKAILDFKILSIFLVVWILWIIMTMKTKAVRFLIYLYTMISSIFLSGLNVMNYHDNENWVVRFLIYLYTINTVQFSVNIHTNS